MRGLARLGAIGLLLTLSPLVSQATTIAYRLTFTIDTIRLPDLGLCDPSLPGHHFGCDFQIGDQFAGMFQLADDPMNSPDGWTSLLTMTSWSLNIGDVNWDTEHASDLAGFRDAAYCGADGAGLGGTNPGFFIANGEITSLCGGAYGIGDIPFLDFESIYPRGRYSAFDGLTGLDGTYVIDRLPLPEPGSLALLVAGLAGLSSTRRRRAAN